jgi:hypothetical protein
LYFLVECKKQFGISNQCKNKIVCVINRKPYSRRN